MTRIPAAITRTPTARLTSPRLVLMAQMPRPIRPTATSAGTAAHTIIASMYPTTHPSYGASDPDSPGSGSMAGHFERSGRGTVMVSTVVTVTPSAKASATAICSGSVRLSNAAWGSGAFTTVAASEAVSTPSPLGAAARTVIETASTATRAAIRPNVRRLFFMTFTIGPRD